MCLSPQEKSKLLKDEYFEIQKFTESFDKLAIQIKQWSVTFSLAAIVGAFASKSQWPIVIAAISSIGFWNTEIWIRMYQYSYYGRLNKIEEFYKGKQKNIIPMQMGSSWFKKFKSIGFRKRVEIAFWPEVRMPHLFIILLASLFLILIRFDLINLGSS